MYFDDVRSRNAFIEVLPGFIFFLSCWLLNTQFIKYGENDSRSYGKAFLVTTVQCVALFIVGIIFSPALVAIISSIASSFK